MTFWPWLWVVVLGVSTAGGVWDDLRSGRSRLYAATGGAAGLACTVFVIVYFNAEAAAALGRFLMPLVAFSAVWIAVEFSSDWRRMSLNPKEDDWSIAIGMVLALALFLPAITLGTIAALREWSDS